MARTKPAPKLPPTPARRAHAQLDRFDQAMGTALAQHRATPRVRAGHVLYKSDGRTPMFYLQGLARIGKATGPKRKTWAEWQLRFKEVEDRIGAYDYWYDLGQRAKGWKVPAALSTYLAEREQQALGAMEYALKTSGWWVEEEGVPTGPGPASAAIRGELVAFDWDGPKKERKAIAAFLRDEVVEIVEKLDDGTIDLDHVELGIHELRRKLRWLPIYGLATGGKIVLSPPDKRGALARYVTPEALGNKYNQLPAHPDEPEPVTLHTGAYLAVSHLIAEIGKLKDRGLWTEELERSGRVAGVDPKAAVAAAGGVRIAHKQLVADVGALVEQVIAKDQALAILAEHFDEQA